MKTLGRGLAADPLPHPRINNAKFMKRVTIRIVHIIPLPLAKTRKKKFKNPKNPKQCFFFAFFWWPHKFVEKDKNIEKTSKYTRGRWYVMKYSFSSLEDIWKGLQSKKVKIYENSWKFHIIASPLSWKQGKF